MELSQLRYFKVLAENGNLRKTAELLYITPSALSGAISRLEKELNASLFDRVQGRLILNDRGRFFLESVSTALAEIDNGEQTVRRLSTLQKNKVSIAVTNSVVWNDMIADFILENPELRLSFRYYNLKQLRELSGIPYDFILCNTIVWKDDFVESMVLTEDNEVMVSVLRDHPLANRNTVSLYELRDEVFLFPPRHTPLNTLYYQYCRTAGFEPNVLVEANYSTMLHLYKRGLGIIFTSSHAKRSEQSSEEVFLYLKDAPRRPPQRICWEKTRRFNQATLTFREFAIRYWKTR